MTSPEKPFVPIDREDQETDKLGSAELGQQRLYGDTPRSYQREAKPKRPLMPAQRRRAGRAAVGPQYGEDALPVLDTKPASQEDADRIHYYTQNWRRVAEEAIKNDTHKVED